MANYNLTNQTIDSTFNQLLQKNETTGYLVDGTGSVVDGLQISGNTSGSFVGDGSGLTNVSAAIPAGTVSGSSQIIFNEISSIPSGLVSGSSQVVLEDTTFTDGENDMFLSTDGAGNISFDWVKTLHQNIKNEEATPILRGTPLFVSGATGDNVNVYRADADNPARRPATLIAFDSTLAPSATGTAIISGEIQGVDTSLYPAGTVVYLGAGGGWSATKPTGSANSVQSLGVITRSSNNGRGIVFNQIGNNLPNISEGYAWVGNGDGVPTAISTASWDAQADLTSLNAFTQSQENLNATFATTGSNTFYGSQTFDMSGNPANSLQITGSNVYITNPSTGQTTQMNGGSVFFPNDGVFMTDEGFKTRRANTSDNELTLSTNPYSFTAFNAPTGSLLNQVGLFFNRDSEFNNVLPTNGIITISTGSAYDGVIHIGDGLNTKIDGNLELGGVFNTPNTLRFVDTQGGPGIMMEIRSGNPNPVITVINSSAASGFGTDLLVQGTSTFIGTTKFTGNTETSGQISGSNIQIQGTALNTIANQSTSPALVLNVGDTSGSILELVNQGATGIFGYGAKFSRNVDIAGSLEAITTSGAHNFVNNNASPDLVMTVGDSSGVIIETANSAATSLFGYGVKLNRPLRVESNTNITEVLNLGAQDPLPTGSSGDLAVSGSNLYFHNGTSWSQIN